MVYTHTHLDNPQFAEDWAAMRARAEAAGVTHCLLPNVDDASLPAMEALQAQHPDFLRLMIGLHPCHVETDFEAVLDRYEARLAADPDRWVAVGEIGLDLYWDKTGLDRQVAALERQLDWSLRWNKPVSIHVRDAWGPLLDVLRRRKGDGLRGVLHCFTGSAEIAREVLDAGWYLGIGGVVTYKNAKVIDVLKEVGLDRVVLETDAPYLAPVPVRGQRNEPAHLAFVRDFLAAQLGMTAKEVDAITTANAQKVFTFA
jgi:TatD DNase family protein